MFRIKSERPDGIQREEKVVESDDDDETSRPQQQRRQPEQGRRRRASPSEDEDEDDDDDAFAGEANLGDGVETQTNSADLDQMVKDLVRLALACEYSRLPIRRSDIAVKGCYSLPSPSSHPEGRSIRTLAIAMFFLKTACDADGGNGQSSHITIDSSRTSLREPRKSSVMSSEWRWSSCRRRRKSPSASVEVRSSDRSGRQPREPAADRLGAALRTDKVATTSKAYALTSILPEKYRQHEDIIAPPKVPTSETEAAYVGLYTFIISVISLNGGRLAEAKLDRYLHRANAQPYTPIDQTEKLLQRLCKEGYLVRVKDSSTGEEMVEYTVGPRGKVEVGLDGVAGLVRTVYRNSDVDNLEARIQRSLGLSEPLAGRQEDDHGGEADAPDGTAANASARAAPTARRSTRQTRRVASSEEEDEDDREPTISGD